MNRRHDRSDHHMGRRASPIRLYRDKARGRCMGVCAGIADYFGLSLTGVRVATVIGLCLATGPVLIIYLVLGFILPDRPRDLYAEPEDELFWRDVRTNPADKARELRHKFRDLERRLRTAEAHVTSKEFKLKREIDEL